MISQEKTVYIPHLDYTVQLLSFERATEGALSLLDNRIMVTERVNPKLSRIYVRFPIGWNEISPLGHEIVHVLQNIEKDYGINIFTEKESVGYLIQYIMGEFMK